MSTSDDDCGQASQIGFGQQRRVVCRDCGLEFDLTLEPRRPEQPPAEHRWIISCPFCGESGLDCFDFSINLQNTKLAPR